MTDNTPDNPVEALRELIDPVCTADDARNFLKALSRLGMSGAALLVVLDRDRRLLDMVTVIDGAEELAMLVELAWCYAEARFLFIAIDRTGETPADRPDDELLWMELERLAAAKDLCLCDLFVVWGSKAFSVAEFAPTPAQWR